jgi:hypothetical protein
MDPKTIAPGSRVEIEAFGEGTVVEVQGEHITVAVSEVETVSIRSEQIRKIES